MKNLRMWWEDRAADSGSPAALRLAVPTRLRVRVGASERLLHVFVVDPTLIEGEYWRDVVGLRHAAMAEPRTLECDPEAILAEVRRSISDDQAFVPAYRFLDVEFAAHWAGVGHQIALQERMVGLPQPFGVLNSITSAAMAAMTLTIDEASVALCAQAIVRDSYSATRVRFQHASAGPNIDLGEHTIDERLALVRHRATTKDSIRRWVGRFPFEAPVRQRWFDDLTRAAFFGDGRFAHAVIASNRALVEYGDRRVAEALDTAEV